MRAIGAIQDWKKGIITLQNRRGNKKKFDMESRKPIFKDEEEEEEDDEDQESTTYSSSEDSADSESEEEADVNYLGWDEEEKKERLDVTSCCDQQVEVQEDKGCDTIDAELDAILDDALIDFLCIDGVDAK